MATGTNVLLGRHTLAEVAAVTWTEGTADYVVGSYTTIALLYRDGEDIETTVDMEEISGFAFARNPVPIAIGSRGTLNEILRYQTAPSILRAIFNETGYIAVRITEGATYKETLIGAISNGRRTIAKGKNVYSLDFETVNIGGANPVIVSS